MILSFREGINLHVRSGVRIQDEKSGFILFRYDVLRRHFPALLVFFTSFSSTK